MIKNGILIIFGALFISACANSPQSAEPWIDYSGVSKIEVGFSPENVVSKLGEPLLILSESDDGDIIVYYYYNYHVKRFILGEGHHDNDEKIRATNLERNTLLKFTFEGDGLVSWEEDKLTLAMALKNHPRSGSTLKYFSFLLNIILALRLL